MSVYVEMLPTISTTSSSQLATTNSGVVYLECRM